MSNFANSIYKDYEKEVIKNKELVKKYKMEKLKREILESDNQR